MGIEVALKPKARSSNNQNLCKAGYNSIHLKYQCSYSTRLDQEESPEALRPARLLYLVANNEVTLPPRRWMVRTDSSSCPVTITGGPVHLCTHAYKYKKIGASGCFFFFFFLLIYTRFHSGILAFLKSCLIIVFRQGLMESKLAWTLPCNQV